MVDCISCRDLATLIASSEHDVVLVDVRGGDECAITIIDGAVNIPLDILPDRMNELPRDKMIVTICHHGMRSKRAAEFLMNNGFDQVVSLTGGMDGWSIDVDPTCPRY